jgi:hypothetical protein
MCRIVRFLIGFERGMAAHLNPFKAVFIYGRE